MPLTIRRPIQIDLDTRQQQDAEERERARLTEVMKRVREKVLRELPEDFRSRVLERAEERRGERRPVEEPLPDFRSVGPSGILGGLRDIGGDIVGGIDRGLEAAAPFAGDLAERAFRASLGGQVAEVARGIPGVPTTGGGPTITDFARQPFVPGAEQIGQAAEFAVRNPLEAAQREVEFGRPVTEPAGRLLGRGAVQATGLGAVDVATQGRLTEIAEDIGGAVAPELVVLSNLVPVEAPLFAGARILFRGVRVAPRALETLARLARGEATREGVKAVTRTELIKFADEAAEAVELGDVPARTETGRPFRERFDVEDITAETRIPPGVSRAAPLEGQQIADLPAGQTELPFPRTRSAQEIAQLAGERRNNLRAIQEGAETGTNTADDVLLAEADLMASRQADNTARLADTEDLTKKSFTDLIDDARRACRG